MSDLIRAGIELADEQTVLSIIRKDAPVFSNNAKNFVEKNLLEYYVATNTWLLAVKQYSRFGWIRLREAIIRSGLRDVIARASQASQQVVDGLPITDGLFQSIYRDVEEVIIHGPRQTPFEPDKMIGRDITATALFLFRYLKRLTPIGADKIDEASIEDFINVENRSKLLQRRGYSQFYVTRVKEEIAHLINWDELCDQLEEAFSDPSNLVLPTGAGRDAKTSIGAKLVAIARSNPECVYRPFGIPHVGVWDCTDEGTWGKHETLRIVTVRAVPKTYKASRIIAMEMTYRQARAKLAERICDRFTPDGCNIHDQTRNQKLAMIGSIDGNLATEDLSHASDCITKTLFWDLFPVRFTRIIYPLLGTHHSINGKVRVMQQMSTAGNGLTFWLEDIVFMGVDLAATHEYELFTSEKLPQKVLVDGELLPVPSVFGDDQVVHSCVHDTLVGFLDGLGFFLNEDKSYHMGFYRESCGSEYLCGEDVSSYYFPRFPIEGKLIKGKATVDCKYRYDSFDDKLNDSLSSLISLQHRLSRVSYEAAWLVYTICKSAFPKMTRSTFGTNVSDCWDYEDIFEKRYAPASIVTHEIPDSKRPWVTEVKWKRVRYEEHLRRAKFTPVIRYELEKDISERDIRLYEAWKYGEFLKHGPRYEDPLMELLHVSAPPKKVEEVYGTPIVHWAIREVEYDF